MSRRTRRLLLFALPAATFAVLFGAWLLWPHAAITVANGNKIVPGMTRGEVEALLGGPARLERPLGFKIESPLGPPTVWASKHATVLVWFDDDKVVRADVTRYVENPVDVLRHWLGL
jgi:hypothetical protein